MVHAPQPQDAGVALTELAQTFLLDFLVQLHMLCSNAIHIHIMWGPRC